MENILKSTSSLALHHELNDFTNKIKDLLDLEKTFQGKIAKTEHLPTGLQSQSEELLKSSYETKKQYEQSLYQLYLGLASYEDTSFESFELFHKLSELQSEEEEISTAPSELAIDRLIHQMKEKIFHIRKRITVYRGKMEERMKVQKILKNEEDLSQLLDNMAQKMEHVNHSIETIERTMEIAEENIVKEVPKKAEASEKLVFQVKKERARLQQRKLWKAIGTPLKQQYRPILSLNLFEECLEESTSVPPLVRQPSYKTPEQIKQEQRKQHAKLHFQRQLLQNGPNTATLERNNAESFVIVSPQLGDWSHVTSPIKTSDKAISSSAVSSVNRTRKDNEFDESLSPLKNALDKVNQLQYTKVVKESGTPSTPSTPAVAASFALPSKPTPNPSSSSTAANNTFSLGGATTKPPLKGTNESAKKGFTFDGFDAPTPTAEKVKNELPPTGKLEKINRRLALVDDEEGEEAAKGGDKGDKSKTSLPPETAHSPINLPSSKKASTNLAGLNDEKASKDIPSFGQKPVDPKATPPATTVSVIDQIKDLYNKYNPDKLAELPKLLQKYDGKHDELYQKLVQKYVKPITNTTPTAPTTTATSQPTNTTPSTNPFANGGQGLSLFGNKTTPTSTNTTSLTSFAINNTTSTSTPANTAATQPATNTLFGGNKSTPTPFSSSASTTPSTSTLFGNAGGGGISFNTQPNQQPINAGGNNGNKFYPIIQEIYEKYNATKLDEINNLLLKYNGKELELIMRLKKKYNITDTIQSEKTILGGMNNPNNATTGFQMGGTVFGGQPVPSGGMNMGQTPSTNPSSLFGGNNLQKTTPTTPFGATNTATASTGFSLGGMNMGMNTPSAGLGASNTNTVFGNNNNNNQAATPFTPAAGAGNGFNTPFNTPAASSKSPFAQNPTTPFGGGAVGGGNASLFGQNNTNAPAAFGQSFGTNPTGGTGNNTLFGSNAGAGGGMVNINDVRNRVVQIYQQFNPTKIAEIPKLLEKYQGREQELISKLEQKYGAGNASVPANAAATNPGAFGMAGMANNNSTVGFGTGASAGGGNTLFGNRAAPSTPFANQGNQNVGFGLSTPGANPGTSLFGGGTAATNAAPRGGSVFGQSSTLGGAGGGGFGSGGGGLGGGSLFGGNNNNSVFGGGFRG